MGTHPATSCSRCPKRFWKAPLKFHQPRWLLRVDFSRLPLANLLHRPVESTVVSHPAPPQKSPIAIARALRATGGKTGGIFGIFLPESIALEPSQNVFWRPRQPLSLPQRLTDLPKRPQTPRSIRPGPIPHRKPLDRCSAIALSCPAGSWPHLLCPSSGLPAMPSSRRPAPPRLEPFHHPPRENFSRAR